MTEGRRGWIGQLMERIAGPQVVRTDTRVLPLVQQERAYWTARANEAAGRTAEAIAGYEALYAAAGDGLRLVPAFEDTADRLSRLKEEAGT